MIAKSIEEEEEEENGDKLLIGKQTSLTIRLPFKAFLSRVRL